MFHGWIIKQNIVFDVDGGNVRSVETDSIVLFGDKREAESIDCWSTLYNCEIGLYSGRFSAYRIHQLSTRAV